MKKLRKIIFVVAMLMLIGTITSVFAFAQGYSTISTYSSINFSGATEGYTISYSDSAEPASKSLGVSAALKDRFGRYSVIKTADGNKYVSYSATSARGSKQGAYLPFFYFTIASIDSNPKTAITNAMGDVDYYVYDLDFTSETGTYSPTHFKMIGRYLGIDANKGTATLQAFMPMKELRIKTTTAGDSYLEFNGNKLYLSKQPRRWYHMTYIIETAQTKSEAKIYVYIDGELLGVLENALPKDIDDESKYYDGYTSDIAMNEVRIESEYTSDETAGISIDNIVARAFAKGHVGDANTGLPKFLENPENSLTECSDSLFTENYEYPFSFHIASVNGTPYDNIDKAFDAALQASSATLVLMSDITVNKTFVVGANKNITFDLNGHSLLTESATDKLNSFSVMQGATLTLKSSSAGGGIFNVSYKDGVVGGAAIVNCEYSNSTVNINGKYLSTYSTSLIDAQGSPKITINNGSYYATANDSYGFIMNRSAAASISVNNAIFSLSSGAYLYSTDSNYASGESNAVFTGCTILAKTKDTAIVNQLYSGSTLTFNDCNIYGALSAIGKGAYGSIVLDTSTRFAGVPTYDGTVFSIPSGYKFAGVDCESVKLDLYYNEFTEIDGRSSDDSLATEKVAVSLNFQTALVTESTKTATVNWLDASGKIFYSEKFSVGTVASFAGEPPVLVSGNEWYDYSILSWKGGTKITVADSTYNFSPEFVPTATTIGGALQSITLYTGFNMHLYLPAPDHTVTGILVTDKDGNIIEEGERQLIDGIPYFVYTISSAATDLAKDHVFNIEYTVTDESLGIEPTTLSTSVKLNVAKYAETLLKGDYSTTSKTLAADMLRYAYECHKLANKTNVSIFHTLLEEYSEYLTDISARFGTKQTYSTLSDYISSVYFRLGSEADYALTVSANFVEGMKIKLTWQSISGETKTEIFEYNPDSIMYATEGMKIYDVSAVMRITIEDAEGNQLALGYYSLATYINAMDGKANIDFAKALYAFSSSAQKYRFPVARQDSVSYSDFGAVGDGVTDDFFSILSAHEFAIFNRVKVKADAGKTYYIGNNGVCTVNITTDTDWTGAKFIIEDNNISLSDPAKSQYVFKAVSDTPSVTYTEKSEGIPGAVIAAINAAGGIKKGEITHLDLGLGRKVLLLVVNNTTAHYIRYGVNENKGSAQREAILIDENGKIDESTPFMFDFSQVTSIEVYSADDTPITITGGEITSNVKIIDVAADENRPYLAERTYNGQKYTLLDNYTSYTRGFGISRSNTTIRGLKHYVGDEGDYGPAYSSFLNASYTNNVLFEDCTVTGHRTFYCWGSNDAKGYVPMGSYDIGAGNANNVTWKNCVQTNFFHPYDSTKVSTDNVGSGTIVSTDPLTGNYVTNGVKYWGIMGSNYAKNLTYDGSKLTRFDAHCGVYNGTVINSEVTVTSIIGGGVFRLENTKMYSNTDAYYLVYLREDYGSTWNGDIIIKDVEWIAERNISELSVLYAVYTNWNFGYTCHLPTNITVDNLRVTTPKGTGSALTLTLFRSQYLANDYSADTYNGVENINKIVLPKTYTVKNNYAGHNYLDPTGKPLFNSAPAGYFTYKYEED